MFVRLDLHAMAHPNRKDWEIKHTTSRKFKSVWGWDVSIIFVIVYNGHGTMRLFRSVGKDLITNTLLFEEIFMHSGTRALTDGYQTALKKIDEVSQEYLEGAFYG